MENEKLQISKLSDDELSQVVGGFATRKDACHHIWYYYLRENSGQVSKDSTKSGLPLKSVYYQAIGEASQRGDLVTMYEKADEAYGLIEKLNTVTNVTKKAFFQTAYASKMEAMSFGDL